MKLTHDFFRSLPPGTQVTIVTVTMAGTDETTPSTFPPALLVAGTEGSPPPGAPSATDEPEGPDDPLLKLRHIQQREHGISNREARRAEKKGFLISETKRDGRDAGALLVRRSDLRAYCARREQIERGYEAAPDGWTGPLKVFP